VKKSSAQLLTPKIQLCIGKEVNRVKMSILTCQITRLSMERDSCQRQYDALFKLHQEAADNLANLSNEKQRFESYFFFCSIIQFSFCPPQSNLYIFFPYLNSMEIFHTSPQSYRDNCTLYPHFKNSAFETGRFESGYFVKPLFILPRIHDKIT